MKRMAFLAALAAAGASGPASAASSLINGGFEQPGSAGVVYLHQGSTFLPGWTVVDSTPGGDDEIAYQNNAAFGGLGVVGSEGAHFLELTGVVGRGKGVKSDAIDTVAGATYRVGFDVGAFFVSGQGSYGDVTLDLRIDDVLVGSFTNTLGLSAAGSDWQRFTHDFVATGAPVRLTFLASTALTSSYLGAGLDNVTFDTIAGPGTGVPEPGAWALAILGFGLAGAGLRRRRSAPA
ncbi:MAG: PEPxxWA-CTERM sorting domain-containing protein [Phenylobacterium sp.]|uniref:PEPxxWA-CTERM sorting domain-containing protein n=1 Tax=Phenylobacterium sp. TaxID=1871053 RepID=UPI001A59324D|nr:PEPxxWA-CTERM sorting domain-containing protein [Phenylobacterium sp.]MBL8555566.1 PEPxxWA-CTERM sorting domain-containing protein [Phenylobacterium sp.]